MLTILRTVFVLAFVAISSCKKPDTTKATPNVAHPLAADATDSGARADAAPDPKINQFFVEWLEAHGEKDVVVDDHGVGLKSRTERLKASIYEIKGTPGQGFTAELEFNVKLTPQRVVTEFVAGIGKTEDEAIKDAKLNFILTTFHVIYRAFMNESDPHIDTKAVELNGSPRHLISGSVLARGLPSDSTAEFTAVAEQFEKALLQLTLKNEPHWIKVVYGQNDGTPSILAVTLDNMDHSGLIEAASKLPWPKLKGFYMAKQFLIIK